MSDEPRAPITILREFDDTDPAPTRSQSPEELRRERAAARARYEAQLRAHGPSMRRGWLACWRSLIWNIAARPIVKPRMGSGDNLKQEGPNHGINQI
jgi:hypothetical protein